MTIVYAVGNLIPRKRVTPITPQFFTILQTGCRFYVHYGDETFLLVTFHFLDLLRFAIIYKSECGRPNHWLVHV